jgi:hypothetical protein
MIRYAQCPARRGMKSLNFTSDTARSMLGAVIAATTAETITVMVVGRDAVWLSVSPTTMTGTGMRERVITTAGAGEGETATQEIEVAGRIAVEVGSRVAEEEDEEMTVVLRKLRGLRFSIRAGSVGGRRSDRELHRDSEEAPKVCAFAIGDAVSHARCM